MPRQVSYDVEAAWKRLREGGIPLEAVAKEFGTTYINMYEVLKKTHKKELSELIKERTHNIDPVVAWTMYRQQGMTLKEIAVALGLRKGSWVNVRRTLEENYPEFRALTRADTKSGLAKAYASWQSPDGAGPINQNPSQHPGG